LCFNICPSIFGVETLLSLLTGFHQNYQGDILGLILDKKNLKEFDLIRNNAILVM